MNMCLTVILHQAFELVCSHKTCAQPIKDKKKKHNHAFYSQNTYALLTIRLMFRNRPIRRLDLFSNTLYELIAAFQTVALANILI